MEKVKIEPKSQAIINWVYSFETGRKWFTKLDVKKSGSIYTKKAYARALNDFCEYMKMTPDEIIANYKEGVKRDLEEALEEWCDYLDGFVDWLKKRETTYTTTRGRVMTYRKDRSTAALEQAAIKSFFKANSKVKLPAGTPSYYSKTIPPVNMDELKIIDGAVDERERFIIRFLKDSGMSRSDVITLNYADVQKDFERGERFIHINAFRRKEEVEYETFVGPNTVEALKIYLQIRRQRGEQIQPDTPLFASNDTPYERLTVESLGSIFKRLKKKTGVDVSPHKLRKFFETYMALRVKHPIILKYWMGHKVRKGKGDIEARYIIPPTPEQRELYMEAYRNIDLSPTPPPEELLIAEIKARFEAMSPEARKVYAKEISTIYREHAGRLLTRPDIKRLLEEENTRTNGGDCNGTFEEIDEKDLLMHLRTGWKVVHNLQNGRVIISKG